MKLSKSSLLIALVLAVSTAGTQAAVLADFYQNGGTTPLVIGTDLTGNNPAASASAFSQYSGTVMPNGLRIDSTTGDWTWAFTRDTNLFPADQAFTVQLNFTGNTVSNNTMEVTYGFDNVFVSGNSVVWFYETDNLLPTSIGTLGDSSIPDFVNYDVTSSSIYIPGSVNTFYVHIAALGTGTNAIAGTISGFNADFTAVPEPHTTALLGAGLLLAAARIWSSKRRSTNRTI